MFTILAIILLWLTNNEAGLAIIFKREQGKVEGITGKGIKNHPAQEAGWFLMLNIIIILFSIRPEILAKAGQMECQILFLRLFRLFGLIDGQRAHKPRERWM